MTAALQPLPSELVSSFAMWRQPTLDGPLLTPPLTSTFESRKMHPRIHIAPSTTLPPISHFDRHLPPRTSIKSHRPPPLVFAHRTPSPVTPPRLEVSCAFHNSTPSSPMLQTPGPMSQFPLHPADVTAVSDPFTIPQQQYPVVDWLDDLSRKRSAHFIAEKTCEMICYLWFSSSPPSNTAALSQFATTRQPPNTTSLQLHASPAFIYFMQKLLETTQVSQSVIVLSLHYIYRLKERNRYTTGQPGSEFRIAVAGLMMANKFLDE